MMPDALMPADGLPEGVPERLPGQEIGARTDAIAKMAVTGAVTIYAFPPGEGSAHVPPRGPRGEDALSRAPRQPRPFESRQAQPRQIDADRPGGATVLEFPDKFSAQLDDDRAYYAASGPRGRTLRLFSTAPTGAFLAQHIAQERLSQGLALEPHAQAAAAYSRSRALVPDRNGAAVNLAI